MTIVKKTDTYSISKRRDGRYSVVGSNGKAINGDDKVVILKAEDLIKVTAPAPVEEVEEVVAEEAAAEPAAEEAPAEEEKPAE
jgi:hypothetical protein|tara:strand:- start:8718 stop:8966 length:249 start_codon:yes stop_codon:yes gene_type:complete